MRLISDAILAEYMNGGCKVSIHSDGTKVREILEPEIEPVHPEQMDLKITDWCDAGCAWCHEKSTKRGAHGDAGRILNILRPLPAGVEIAIGGGDPLSHPDFKDMVREMRSMGLIPSVTVNGRHLERHLDTLQQLTSEGSLFGVGISFFQNLPEWDYPHKVIHMIAGVDNPRILDGAPRQKILLLGYKSYGRGLDFKTKKDTAVRDNIALWFRSLLWIAREHHVSFDTLAISQMKPERLFKSRETYEKRYMGDEGEFSMYVDGVKEEYALSSYSPDRHKWTDIISMFQHVRKTKGDSK